MPASLARQYAEPITLMQRDGVPDRFRWHGRSHQVRAVLDHWVVTAAWWTRSDVPGWDDEREYWRVEAAAGPGRPIAVVDLCLEPATGRWTLHRLFD